MNYHIRLLRGCKHVYIHYVTCTHTLCTYIYCIHTYTDYITYTRIYIHSLHYIHTYIHYITYIHIFITLHTYVHKTKKISPVTGLGGPEGSRKLRFSDFMTKAQEGGKVVSLTHRPHLPPGNSPGTHFC